MKVKCRLAIFVTVCLSPSMFAHATVWYVHPDSTLNSVQSALDYCSANDTVLVGPGIYYESLVWPSVLGIDLVSEYGPDSTVIDGNGGGSVLVIASPVDSSTLVEGFTIQGGDADIGGGIRCQDASPCLNDLIITDNTASSGGGVHLNNSSPLVTNTTITGNLAQPCSSFVTACGGGIYFNDYSNATLINVAITQNIAEPAALGLDGQGGGIFCRNSSPELINVTIAENTAEGFYALGCGGAGCGGGMYCCAFSNPTLVDVTISGNSAVHTGCHGNASGGGIHCLFCSLDLENVTISDNTASGVFEPAVEGGGIYSYYSNLSLVNVTISGNIATVPSLLWIYGGGINCSGGTLVLRNTLITGNSCAGGGGGFFCNNCSPILDNAVICDNTANEGGGIFCGNPDPSYPSLANCILWNNTPQQIQIFSGSVTVAYSDVQGGWPGTGNLYSNPMFVNGPLSNYHLSSNSPCIDAGNPDFQYDDPEDPLNPGYALWPAQGLVRNDMGVYGGPTSIGWLGIQEQRARQPKAISWRISPNPFSERVNIELSSEHILESIELRIYDIAGRSVKELSLQTTHSSTPIHIYWNGTDDSNRRLPSGVYFLKLEADGYTAAHKLLLIH
jgi:hypothetical protein